MYSGTMTAADWIFAISGNANQLVTAAQNGSILSDKFSALTSGKSDADILAMPQFSGWTQADLTNVKYALGALKEVESCINNGAVSQSNRFGYFEPFLL